ncbi:hypothetical protein [Malikia spinosa]|uniref:Uncharacterized protein n=1 Tax=Malikia spinosa TaxID=86180 RepID=A0A7C9MQU8_9BURK|nr:hypothetical protein [Malikia spinosa]MYZ51218.1 hypothetical protein [Malikia spinosa]
MFVTYSEFQVKNPSKPALDNESSYWDMLIYRDNEQQGWFTAMIESNEFANIFQSILAPYPSGIGLIVESIGAKDFSVKCVQYALFDRQSSIWDFHVVEEIWRVNPSALSEDSVEVFRLQGRGLLDSSGNLVKMKLGDKLELIYQSSRI